MGFLTKDVPPADTTRPNGPGTLEDVAVAHASEAAEKGRPPLPSTGDPKKDARREADRARYAAKRGRPPNQPSIVYSPRPDLFTPETCGAIVRLPFDIAGVALRSTVWTLDKDEAAMVAGPCAETLNLWFPEADPKWAALTALSLAFMTVASKKYLMFQEEHLAKRKAADESKPV